MKKKKASLLKIPGLFAFNAIGLAAYWFLIRPWHRKWSVIVQEATSPLPGDDLIPDAPWRTAHAITIRAPIETV